jgi:hypothetical protein
MAGRRNPAVVVAENRWQTKLAFEGSPSIGGLVPTVPVCTQAPKDGTLFKGKEEEYLICAREERAKPIGDRRAGRWSPCGAGAEAGRGRRPRGFSVGPERTTSESEARVAARLMRRGGRSFSAGISRKPEPGTYLPRATK